jgi:signal peptidase
MVSENQFENSSSCDNAAANQDFGGTAGPIDAVVASSSQSVARAAKSPSPVRRRLGTVKNIITWVLVVMVVAVMAFVIFGTTALSSTGQTIFGHNAFIVQSDSMSATDFGAGDVIITKAVDPTTLKEGDIITFTSRSTASYGETVTHKIREVTTDSAGNPGFVTYGTTTDSDDDSIVSYNQIIGQYQFAIPQAGNFFVFLKTVPGYFIFIFAPFLILILLQAYNTFKLYKQYKREVAEEAAAAKAKAAQTEDVAEENARLQAELAALRAQMGGQSQSADSVAV